MEYLEGRRVVHQGERLPHPVLANSAYADSARFVASLPGGSERDRALDGRGSLQRYARAAQQAEAFGRENDVKPLESI